MNQAQTSIVAVGQFPHFRSESSSSVGQDKSKKKSRSHWSNQKNAAPWMEGVAYLIVFLIGFMFVTRAGGAVLNGMAAGSWPTANGHVTKSSISRKSVRRRKTFSRTYFRHNFEYAYSVAGRNYSGEKIGSFDDTSFRWEDSAEQLQRKFPVGMTVVVYYAPDDPSNAMLVPGIRFRALPLVLIGLPMIGLSGWFAWVRRKKWWCKTK